MRTVSPYILVQLDHKGHRQKNVGGILIELQKQYRTDLNKRYMNCDRGWVVAMPGAKEIADCPVDVKTGDYVFFHFHTLKPENEVWVDGVTYYKVHYSNVFFKVSEDQVITPLNRYVFTEILTEKDEAPAAIPGYVTVTTYELTNKSKVVLKPEYVDSVEVGDVVIHKSNTHYDVELPDGKRYYRLREKEIIGIIEEDGDSN